MADLQSAKPPDTGVPSAGTANDVGSYFECDRLEIVELISPATSDLLDVGCGSGAFGRAVKQKFSRIRLTGVELNDQAARIAGEAYDHVAVGHAGDVLPTMDAGSYDCIVFNDVLEHMTDPWETLDAAVPLLRPDGVVIASIPNVRFLPVCLRLVLRGRWDYTPAGVLDSTHVRFFTRSTMEEMFRRAGFCQVQTRGINPSPHVLFRLGRLLPVIRRDMQYPQFALVATGASGGNAAAIAGKSQK